MAQKKSADQIIAWMREKEIASCRLTRSRCQWEQSIHGLNPNDSESVRTIGIALRASDSTNPTIEFPSTDVAREAWYLANPK